MAAGGGTRGRHDGHEEKEGMSVSKYLPHHQIWRAKDTKIALRRRCAKAHAVGN